MILDVLVVGAGLSGMHLAQRLSLVKQCQFKLLEASGLVGGRLRNDNVHNQIDLGGAWIWPEFQPKMARLVSSLGVQTFAQPDDPSSTRIVGGAVRLVEKLAEQVPSDNIKLNSPVISCSLKKNNTASNDSQTCSEGDYIEIKTANQEVFQAKRVVFAAPPKLIAKHITFDPPLNTEKWHAMMQSETWMAGTSSRKS